MTRILTTILLIMTTVTSCSSGNEDKESVVINGIRWATRNVDTPGKFAASSEDAGMFYQWNRKIGWSVTDPIINSNGGSTWDDSYSDGETWEKANDPSPAGYRVPTELELASLLNDNKVNSEWITQNGVFGRRFTDKDNGNFIFLPAAGYRDFRNGTLRDVGAIGKYWSLTWYGAYDIAYLHFYSGNANLSRYDKTSGHSVRPVAK